jgi:hypothetical protein
MTLQPLARAFTSIRLVLASCALMMGVASCATPSDSAGAAGQRTYNHVTLPSRDVQASLEHPPADAYDAARQCLEEQMGYRVDSARMDQAAGSGRIDAVAPDGHTARVLIKPGRIPLACVVQVFAVPAGSRSGDTALAGDILKRIDDTLEAGL